MLFVGQVPFQDGKFARHGLAKFLESMQSFDASSG